MSGEQAELTVIRVIPVEIALHLQKFVI